jgi:adenosylcobinamide-GDP ribazoletransferase
MNGFRDNWRDAFLAALAFLTRFPVGRADAETAQPDLADASWAFPLVGVVVGAIGGIAYAIASALALPGLAAALIAVATTALVTGALPETALANTADNLGSGPRQGSGIGTFGTLALIVSVGLRTIAIADAGTRWHVFAALIAAHALSRAALPAAMRWLEPTPDEASDPVRPQQNQVLIALGGALVIAVIFTGLRAGLSAALAAAIVAVAIGFLAQRRLGGDDGSTLGAIEQGAETATLLAAAAWI